MRHYVRLTYYKTLTLQNVREIMTTMRKTEKDVVNREGKGKGRRFDYIFSNGKASKQKSTV